MVDVITIPKPSAKPAVPKSKLNFLIYLGLGLLINGAIWGAALVYLQIKKPSYSSEMTISLPGTDSSTSVNLPGIGQASSQSQSPYFNTTAKDPRQNYQFILQSDAVLKAAAARLNMTVGEFGKPTIKVVDSTTIMRLELQGASPEEAKNKSLTLYQAFEEKLNQVREQEIRQQDAVLQASLASAQNKLKEAQKKLSEYQARSGLSSSEQITDLSVNIENLRRQRSEIIAQQQQANGRLVELGSNLNLSAKEAADAFTLQTDPIFQKALQDYSESNGTYVSLNAKFLPNHPAVIDEKAKLDAARSTLVSRATSLLGRPISPAAISQLNLSNTGSSASARTALSQDLVAAQAARQGFQAQAQALDRQITELETRLKLLAQQGSTLDAYKRDLQIAEVVFSSTLTRLDLSKSNVFASYPQIQILSEATLPVNPSSPKKPYVFLGAALGSFFCTNALVLLWMRQRKKSIPTPFETTTPVATQLIPVSAPEMVGVGKSNQSSNHNGNGRDIGR